jgi:hypothetical protein
MYSFASEIGIVISDSTIHSSPFGVFADKMASLWFLLNKNVMSAVIVGPSSSPKTSIAQADALEIEAQAKRRLANGNGHDPRPAFLECREGRAGHRLEVDDPIAQSESSAVVPATF